MTELCKGDLSWAGTEDPATRPECLDEDGKVFRILEPYSETVEFVFLGLTTVCLLLLFALTAHLYKHRRDKAILKSSPTYLAAILVGYAFLLIAFYLWPLESTKGLCYSKPWFLALGYGLIAGALLVKIYRAYFFFALAHNPDRSLPEIMEYQSAAKQAERNRNLKVIFGVIVAVEVTLLVLMLAIPQTRPDVRFDCCEDGEIIYTTCTFNATFGWVAFAINVIPLFFGVYWVYHIFKVWMNVRVPSTPRIGRSTMSSFSSMSGESAKDLIARALQDQIELLKPVLYVILVTGTIALFMTVVGYSDFSTSSSEAREGYYIMRGACFLFVTMCTLLLIFQPVVKRIRASNRKERPTQSSTYSEESVDPSAKSKNESGKAFKSETFGEADMEVMDQLETSSLSSPATNNASLQVI